MLGNRPGWIIAALIAAALACTAWQLLAVNRLTEPTALAKDAAVGVLAFEVPPSAVFRADAPGDSGALYREAVADIRQNPERYAAVEQSTAADAFEQTPAGRAVLAAASFAGAVLLAADPAAWGGYEWPADDLDAVQLAARCLTRAALLHRAADPARSRAAFEAEFALGTKLFAERARYAEAAVGLAIAREAAAGLRSLAERENDARRVGMLTTFDRSAGGLQDTRLSPVWNALGAVDARLIAEHAGDVHALAGPATRERMWRAEAVLALGRHRFNVERDADRLIVPRRLAELEAGETDPLVRAAIRAAKSLTVEQFRTLR